MPLPPKAKARPKVLKRKNIRRRTGNKSQSKQIMALNRGLNALTRQNFARIRTCWQRDKIGIIPNTVGNRLYMCPLPYAPCDPLNTAGVTNTWNDNIGGVNFTKRLVFGYPQSAVDSNLGYHTGGILRYQFITTLAQFNELNLYVIKPKKKMADQLSIDRNFKSFGQGSRPGINAELHQDIDYTVHSGAGTATVNATNFGSEINKKYWDVVAHKKLTFSHPNAVGFAANTNANNASPSNNAIVRTGSMKLPAGGLIRNSSYTTQTGSNPEVSAMEMGFLDQQNENTCFLVIIQNGIPDTSVQPAETIMGGIIVNDYYKLVV